jgi:hypothetical protein
MNVDIGAEAAQFPEKVYIYGIFVAVQHVPTLQFALQRNYDLYFFSGNGAASVPIFTFTVYEGFIYSQDRSTYFPAAE